MAYKSAPVSSPVTYAPYSYHKRQLSYLSKQTPIFVWVSMPRIPRNTKGRQPRVNKTSRKETTQVEWAVVTTLYDEGPSVRSVSAKMDIPKSTIHDIVKHAHG